MGYFFDVITNGFTIMPSYASQVAPQDRWAIVAYLRALQLSQGAHLAELPAEDRQAVAAASAVAAAAAGQPGAGHGAEGH